MALSGGRRALLASLLLVAAGCVPSIGDLGNQCPCADGYRCCSLDVRCHPNAEPCPTSLVCPVPPVVVSSPQIEIGTTDGELSGTPLFIPLRPGGHLQLVKGIQGGYHVWTEVRLSGLGPHVTLTRCLVDPTNPSYSLRNQSQEESLVSVGNGKSLLLQDNRTYVCPSLAAGQRMYDRDLVLRVGATDGQTTVSAEATIHPDCPDDGECSVDASAGCGAQ